MKEIESLKRKILINDIIIIFFLGIILNLSVIVFNDSRMPVFFHESETLPIINNSSYVVFSDSNEVKYAFLSDVLKVWKLRFSIGDVLIFGSIASIIFVFINGIIQSRRLKNGIVISNEQRNK